MVLTFSMYEAAVLVLRQFDVLTLNGAIVAVLYTISFTVDGVVYIFLHPRVRRSLQRTIHGTQPDQLRHGLDILNVRSSSATPSVTHTSMLDGFISATVPILRRSSFTFRTKKVNQVAPYVREHRSHNVWTNWRIFKLRHMFHTGPISRWWIKLLHMFVSIGHTLYERTEESSSCDTCFIFPKMFQIPKIFWFKFIRCRSDYVSPLFRIRLHSFNKVLWTQVFLVYSSEPWDQGSPKLHW